MQICIYVLSMHTINYPSLGKVKDVSYQRWATRTNKKFNIKYITFKIVDFDASLHKLF